VSSAGQSLRIRLIQAILLFVVALGAIFLILMGGAAAHADYVYPYPSYTHSQASGGLDTAKDPINLFFGGTWEGHGIPGYWGSADGVVESLEMYTSYFDPILGSDQYVLFASYLGYQQWRQQEHQLATSFWLGPRYHLRLFQCPYPTASGSYAEKNCAAGIHHEDFDHDVDMSWETVESAQTNEWDDLANYIINPNEISNTPSGYWPSGSYLYTNGLVTKCRVYPW
jgi:hypothetical protein